jgi:hypothetical protein
MTEPVLDYFTAKPILELMLAQHQMEAPYLAPGATLPIFAQFLALPYAGSEDGGSYQADVVSEGPEGGSLYINLCRQIPSTADDEEPAFASTWRQVGIQWLYDMVSVGSLESETLWARDFPSIEAFIEAIENTEGWRVAVAAGTVPAEVVIVDEGDT